MKQLHAPLAKINHISSGLRPDEAAAVLAEMQWQAEHRLLDACQEFQDIAFEMEWRMNDWHALVEERARLAKEGVRLGALSSHFNVSARQRSGKRPRSVAWQRLARAYKRRFDQLEARITECAAAIMTRNEEGRYLEQEILMLQERIDRIAGVLKASGRRSRISVVRDEDETAAALARLAIEMSIEPDVADLDVLIGAFETLETRRQKVRRVV